MLPDKLACSATLYVYSGVKFSVFSGACSWEYGYQRTALWGKKIQLELLCDTWQPAWSSLYIWKLGLWLNWPPKQPNSDFFLPLSRLEQSSVANCCCVLAGKRNLAEKWQFICCPLIVCTCWWQEHNVVSLERWAGAGHSPGRLSPFPHLMRAFVSLPAPTKHTARKTEGAETSVISVLTFVAFFLWALQKMSPHFCLKKCLTWHKIIIQLFRETDGK